MDLKEQILAECLGAADGLWWPIRDPRAPWWPAVWYLRWRYPARGLPWRGGGDKEHERALGELVRAGLVIRRRAQRKTIGAKLTDAGLRAAWRLTGNHPWLDVIVYDEVLRHGPAGAWIPEIAFNEGRGWGDGHAAELKVIDSANVAGLTSGLVESNCLMSGAVCYRATTRPRPDVPPGDLEADAPPRDPEAWAVYLRALRETIGWLDSQTGISVGARGEIGQLPLPPFALRPYRDAGGFLPGMPPQAAGASV